MIKHIVFLLLLGVGAACASNYYVDCNLGSNGNSGTQGQAWRTPLEVTLHSANPGFASGDAIYFKRGCTWHEGFSLTSSGASGNPITIDSFNGDRLRGRLMRERLHILRGICRLGMLTGRCIRGMSGSASRCLTTMAAGEITARMMAGTACLARAMESSTAAFRSRWRGWRLCASGRFGGTRLDRFLGSHRIGTGFLIQPRNCFM